MMKTGMPRKLGKLFCHGKKSIRQSALPRCNIAFLFGIGWIKPCFAKNGQFGGK
jgi:hypothetical protein